MGWAGTTPLHGAFAVTQGDRPVLVLGGQFQLPPLLCAQTTHTHQLVHSLASRGSPCRVLTVLASSLQPPGPPSPVRAHVHTAPYCWGGKAYHSRHSAVCFVTVATNKITWVTRHILPPRLHPDSLPRTRGGLALGPSQVPTFMDALVPQVNGVGFAHRLQQAPYTPCGSRGFRVGCSEGQTQVLHFGTPGFLSIYRSIDLLIYLYLSNRTTGRFAAH